MGSWRNSATASFLASSCLVLAHRFYFQVSENNEVVEKPIKLPTLSNKLVQKSVDFIKNSEGDSRPFLLYHSFAHVHTPLDTEDTFRGVSLHGRYGDVLAEVISDLKTS